MIQITKSIEWDMGHRVPNHRSKCRNPHGHRYRMELTLTGNIIRTPGDSSEGMVLDFGDIKKIMMNEIHDVLDHGFMIYEHDQILADFFALKASEHFKVIMVPFVPTVENISNWCYQRLSKSLPENVWIYNVRLYETPNSWADCNTQDKAHERR